ncbi:transcription antitermination factor NusB [Lacticaseibacillus pabuli]|uniref:Transcription antitermination protein NusB n=1 Tax=Lacticaseibacillus pabuli TaxID=3025672 RepID=A0ABY7WU19_9LACO|nr:transcription antitermination factor NusB [Lacticaseibacillus sp. KACC 23028]WDF83667.1 transcription antitermination factor NusB [Lacticaseibacillus sp. KACC 23028]
MLNRHEIREAAFKALFAIDKNPDADRDVTYAAVLPEDEVIPGYMLQLIDGVSEHTADLDEKLSGKLKSGWTLSRISKTDLIILRLGLYEIQYEDDLPDKSAINEAVEIAKTYADEQSAKFINGVLANFISAQEA